MMIPILEGPRPPASRGPVGDAQKGATAPAQDEEFSAIFGEDAARPDLPPQAQQARDASAAPSGNDRRTLLWSRLSVADQAAQAPATDAAETKSVAGETAVIEEEMSPETDEVIDEADPTGTSDAAGEVPAGQLAEAKPDVGGALALGLPLAPATDAAVTDGGTSNGSEAGEVVATVGLAVAAAPDAAGQDGHHESGANRTTVRNAEVSLLLNGADAQAPVRAVPADPQQTTMKPAAQSAAQVELPAPAMTRGVPEHATTSARAREMASAAAAVPPAQTPAQAQAAPAATQAPAQTPTEPGDAPRPTSATMEVTATGAARTDAPVLAAAAPSVAPAAGRAAPRSDRTGRDGEVAADATPAADTAPRPARNGAAAQVADIRAMPDVLDKGPDAALDAPIDPQADALDLTAADGRGLDAPARTESAPRIEAPRHVTMQVAEAAKMLRDGPVELALSPEELGKVKLTLSAGHGTMTLTVTAERPETLDLLRRNIDMLAEDFRDLGYDSLNFSFGHEGSRQPAPTHAPKAETAAVALPTPGFATTPAARTVHIAGAGLDLRL